ncbi:hypothetical protein BH10CYA1_BH10CYA1_22660 [soil metagenome]
MVEKKFSETLVILLTGTNTVEQPKIDEAVKSAKNLNVPLERALIMLGHASELSLKSIMQAQELIKEGKISLDMAVKALRFAKQNHLDLDEAVTVLSSVHKKTMVLSAVGNDLTNLMLAAAMINQEQLGRALTRAHDSGMQMGRILVLNRDLSTWMMSSALAAQLLIRDGKISKEDAIQGLQAVGRRRISIEQALFELGLYRETPGQSVKIGELCLMAGFMGESDMLECLEIEIVKEKQFGQILLEQGHVTNPVLEAAVYLQDMVSNDTLRAYQAAEALKQVRVKEVSVYQAVAELQPPPQMTPQILAMQELLAQSDIATAEQIAGAVSAEEESSIKVGKKVLAAGMVNEATLYVALRCFSLLREGFVSNEQAVQALSNTQKSGGTLDETLVKLGLTLPSRMQWIWT